MLYSLIYFILSLSNRIIYGMLVKMLQALAPLGWLGVRLSPRDLDLVH